MKSARGRHAGAAVAFPTPGVGNRTGKPAFRISELWVVSDKSFGNNAIKKWHKAC
jgi:hypothetical protein